MEDLARELFYYLPVIISLGLSNMMKKVTDVETRIYDGILNTDRDDRQAQVFINYDRVHGALEEAIDDYGLPKPILFQKIPIDRTALTFYSKRKVNLVYVIIASRLALREFLKLKFRFGHGQKCILKELVLFIHV